MQQKTILITGTSSGFGKLAVPLLLERGHTIIAGLRGGEKRLAEIFSAEREKFPGRLHALDLHMEKPESAPAARERVSSQFGGRLDVLVNNAGFGLFGALEDQSPEQLRYQFDVNFFGPVALTRELLPALRAARGRVIHVTSICGLVSFPLYGAYCASKHALEAMAEAMYYDERKNGVQVALVEPGGFRTEFSGKSRIWGERSFTEASLSHERSLALQNAFETTSARLGDPIRVARKIVRLCERERIPLRTLVGPDAWAMNFMRKLLPDSLRVTLEDTMFRMAVFKGK